MRPPAALERHDLATSELRVAFTRGPTLEAAHLFLRQRDAGLDWESATMAVAAGVAEHFGRPATTVEPASAPPVRATSSLRVLRLLLAGVVLIVPLVGIGRELTVAALAFAVRAFAVSGVWQTWVSALGLDPIYTGAAITSFASVQVAGLAIAPPFGTGLHAVWPNVFPSPDLLPNGAFASMVAVPGANILARAAASFGADVLWLTIGVLLLVAAGRRWAGWTLLGVAIQAEIVFGYLAKAQVSARELESSGLPFAMALFLPGAAWQATEQLAALPERWQATTVRVLLLVLAYALALCALGAFSLATYAASRVRRRSHSHKPADATRLRLGSMVTMALAASVVSGFAYSATNWQPIIAEVPRSSPDTAAAEVQPPPDGALDRPHSVRLVQSSDGGGWQYLVNGVPEAIRGIGYNPQYARLPEDERARLYQRDFAAIRSAGANAIEGWFESEFDEVTLAAAAENSLGVILPFELNQDWNYADVSVQSDILRRVSAWVVRYRDAPALRMWAPGNENLHRILYPNWVSQENQPAARAHAQAFAAFLPRLVDRIHELDPDHPVLYRDAEDVYLGWLKPEFARRNVAPSWFVYGANVYSESRLREIIARWPAQWIGGPLVISEFAPAGRGPDERSAGFQQNWRDIRARPDVVLGGLAYTWATNGPEDLDRVFGLVDPAGKPRDAALAGLASAYLADQEPSVAVAALPTRSDHR